MLTQASQPLSQIITNFLTRRNIVDNECLLNEVYPIYFVARSQRVIFGQNDKDTLGPKMLGLAIDPMATAGKKSNVKGELAYRRDMFRWIPIYELHLNPWMPAMVGAQ